MRQPLSRRSAPGAARARPLSLPAPYAGINGVDALAGGMGPADAVDLVNMLCVDGAVQTRPGYRTVSRIPSWLSSGAVRFIHPLPGAEVGTIFAAGGRLYLTWLDNAKAGTISNSAAKQSDDWCAAVMNDRVFLVNGVDQPMMIEGTTGSYPEWTGPSDIRKLSRIRAHAKRLFFAEQGSARFWYTAAPGNITGELKSFDLSGVGNRGGVLTDIVTLAPDGGMGGDDDAVAFFMSSGEVIVYRGSNPDDAAAWGRVGVFTMARPLATASHAGDVLTVSADGYAELSRLLPSGRSPVAGFGSRLGRIAREAVARWGNLPGWQVLYSPQLQSIIVNMPQSGSAVTQQHVLNLVSGGWSRWTDLPATCWGHHRGRLCFGTPDGRICLLGGDSDDGRAIVATAQGAWGTLGAPGLRKRVGLVKPVLTARSAPAARHVLGVDFKTPLYGASAVLDHSADLGIWDASVWDAAEWGGAERVTAQYRGGGAIGEWFAMGLRVDSRAGPVTWLGTTILVEQGA